MENLQKLRKEAGLSQEKLGEIVHLSDSTIGSYETGRRSPDAPTLIALCQYFHVSADYMLDLTDIRQGAKEVMEDSELAELIHSFPEDYKQYLKETLRAYKLYCDTKKGNEP